MSVSSDGVQLGRPCVSVPTETPNRLRKYHHVTQSLQCFYYQNNDGCSRTLSFRALNFADISIMLNEMKRIQNNAEKNHNTGTRNKE